MCSAYAGFALGPYTPRPKPPNPQYSSSRTTGFGVYASSAKPEDVGLSNVPTSFSLGCLVWFKIPARKLAIRKEVPGL